MSAWTVAPIALKCAPLVSGDDPIDHIVAGWVQGPFGLDFRVFDDDVGDFSNTGFVLTHLPTGMIVRQIVGVGMAEAMALADEILAAADWSFTDAPPQECKLAVAALIKAHPGVLSSGHRMLGPAA